MYMEDIINDYKEDRKTYTCQGIYYDMTNLIHCFSYFKKYQNYLESLFQSGLSRSSECNQQLYDRNLAETRR